MNSAGMYSAGMISKESNAMESTMGKTMMGNDKNETNGMDNTEAGMMTDSTTGETAMRDETPDKSTLLSLHAITSTSAALEAALAKSCFDSARRMAERLELEEARALFALACALGSGEASLHCAKLLLMGKWNDEVEQLKEEAKLKLESDMQHQPAKVKGKLVIKEIRAMQKANRLGMRYDATPPRDPKQAVKLLKFASSDIHASSATRGNACLELGKIRFFPDKEEDFSLITHEEAIGKLEQAAVLEHTPGAWYMLGTALYENSDENDFASKTKALECFKHAAEQENDPEAYYFLGHYLKSTESDLPRARELFLKAADELEHGPSNVYLAKWALETEDLDEARERMKLGLKYGDAEAAHLLADGHFYGSFGLVKDLTVALQLYQIAGAGGEPEGWLSAGAMFYERGDYEECYRCYEKAAEGGNSDAWRRIADLYMTGRGVALNKEAGERILKLLKESE